MNLCAPHLGLRPESDLGGEVSERALLSRLAALGDTVRLLIPPEAETGPTPPGWRIERWGRRRARRWWRSNGAAARALVAAHHAEAFELAHLHSGLHFGRGALAARRRLRARFPIVVHHLHLEGTRLERALETAACRSADAVAVPSRFTATALAEAGGPAGARVVVIPRGVERPAGLPARPRPDERGGAGGRAVILSVGRLVPRKNPLLLVDVMAEVDCALRGVARLRFIGGGPLARDIARRARALGIEDLVELRGRCSEAEKWREIAGCAAFVTASRLEGFGLSVAEAMAAGAPVVAPNAASFPELIEDGVSGVLAPRPDSASLASALIAILRQPGRARALGEAAARRAASAFSWDAAARRLRELYAELIARSRLGL